MTQQSHYWAYTQRKSQFRKIHAPRVHSSTVHNSQDMCVCSLVSDSWQPRGPQPAGLLCPWTCSGKNTGAGCHFLLQGIFPTQGSNLHLTSPAVAGGFSTTSTTWEAQPGHESNLNIQRQRNR